jgi:hypothetical protein
MAQNNLRIIYDNVVSSATLTTSTAASGLPVTNLQREQKGLVWRSTTTTATITANWATPQTFHALVLPFCNLTPTATIRVRAYVNPGDTNPVLDTGAQPAGAYTPEDIWGGAQPNSANSYSLGGGSYARLWFARVVARKLEITIADTANGAGYLEASYLVCGDYWSPTYNTNFGLSIGYTDSSAQTRTEAGTLLTSVGTIHRTLDFDLQWLVDTDKTRMLSILRGNGLRKPLFVSIFPEDVDKRKEQEYQIYAKLSDLSKITHPVYSVYTSNLSLQEV